MKYQIYIVITLIWLGTQALPVLGQYPARFSSSGLVQPASFSQPEDLKIPSNVAAEPIPHGEPVKGIPGMTVSELKSLALQHNPTLVQARMRVQAARGKHLQVGLYPNPVVGYVGEDMGIERTAGQQGGFVGQEIVTNGKLRLRRAVASHEIVQANCALEAQEMRVANDVRIGWFNVLLAQRVVDLNSQLVQIGQHGVDATERLLVAKEVSRVDVLQAKVEADSARLKLFNAKNQYLAAWRGLAAVVGLPDMAPTRLLGDPQNDIPELSWDGVLQCLLDQSPELAEADAGVERAQCELASQCAERIPNLEFLTSVRHDNPDRRTVAGVELAWAVPIYNRNQGNIVKAKANLVAARREVGRLELALQSRLAVAFARYANARNEVRNYTASILPNAKTSLTLIEQGYRQGEFGYLKLLTAQRTYFRVNEAYLKSLLEAHTKAVQIEGLLLTGGLGEMIQDEGLRVFGAR